MMGSGVRIHLAAPSIAEHGHCRPALSGLQFQEQRAGIFDVALGAALGRRLQGNRGRMVWAAHEHQSFRQALHGRAVDRLFVHSRYPQIVVARPCAGPSLNSGAHNLEPSLAKMWSRTVSRRKAWLWLAAAIFVAG